MAGNNGREERQPFIGKPLATRLALVAAVALGGCSDIPKAMNPVEWAKSVGDVFTSDDGKTANAQKSGSANQAIPGEKDSFPKLGTAGDAEAARARRPQTRGLVGDTASSRYSEPVARQGAATNPLGGSPDVAPPSVPVKPAAAVSNTVEPPKMPEALSAPPPVPAPAAAQATAAPEAPRMASAPPAPQMSPAPLAPRTDERALPSAPVRERTVAAPMPTMPSFPAADQTVVVSGDGIVFEGGPQAAMAGYAAATPAMPARSPADGIPSASGLSTGGMVRVATIQFGNGTAGLDDQDQAVLRDVAKIVKQRGGKRIVIIGHASSRTADMDTVRHSMVNYEVSARRADTVAKALAGFGVKRDIIDARAAADQQPVFYEIMPSGEAGNRRTEVYVEF